MYALLKFKTQWKKNKQNETQVIKGMRVRAVAWSIEA